MDALAVALGQNRTPCRAENFRPDWFAKAHVMPPACFWCLNYLEKQCRGCDPEPFDMTANVNKMLHVMAGE